MRKQPRLSIRQQFSPALLIHVYALLLGVTYLLGGLLDRPVLLFGPLTVCGFLAAIAIGITRSAGLTAGRRLASSLRWGLIWALLCILPFATSWTWLRFEASRVPYPDDWEATVSVDPVLFDNKPNFIIRYKSADSIPVMVAEVVGFYDERGFTIDIGSQASQPFSLYATVPPVPGYDVTFEIERGRERLFVMIWSGKPEGAGTTIYTFAPGAG